MCDDNSEPVTLLCSLLPPISPVDIRNGLKVRISNLVQSGRLLVATRDMYRDTRYGICMEAMSKDDTWYVLFVRLSDKDKNALANCMDGLRAQYKLCVVVLDEAEFPSPDTSGVCKVTRNLAPRIESPTLGEAKAPIETPSLRLFRAGDLYSICAFPMAQWMQLPIVAFQNR